jgi:5'-3' exonuclease
MGIPSYFSYIIKNYPNIIRNIGYFYNVNVEHLYMDCNSIIYDAVHSLDNSNPEIENEIIKTVIQKIEFYIGIIKPSKTAFIAFDGVAPFAKMTQQRTRRYKSVFMSKICFDNSNTKQFWNTSAITPGTQFMTKLAQQIEYSFKYSEKKYGCENVIVSTSNDVGEGEHKLFQHLRNNDFKNHYVAVYGLDADLIMLSIFHLKYCKNIYVFREAPEFLKSSIPLDIRGKETEPYFLDIQHLSHSILTEMNCQCSDSHRIYDYVFLCFFLGNDFLPHFPAMNIRTHGIQGLLDVYRLCIGNQYNKYLIYNNKIQWRNVGILLNEISKKEHQLLINEYFVRDKFDRRQYPETTPKEKNDVLQNVPIIYRQKEKYICPDETEWEKRYYKCLFGLERNNENLKIISNNYLEGLEWTFKYYTFGCPHWRWKYNYHYPPLFVDLCKYVPHYETDFISSDINDKPFSKYAQLSYVLPSENLHFLPQKICEFLKSQYSELYPLEFEFEWSYCKYLWEAHPILPEISLHQLGHFDIQFSLFET